jgi:putative phosphoesterase
MLLGLLSDSHDRIDALAAGIRALREAGAEYFLHCGDIGSERAIDQLAGLPAAFVWGNTDGDRLSLARYAESIGVTCYGNFGELELGGKRIALLHGDDAKLKQKVLAEQQYDYLFQGHTHVREDRRVGRVRVINPGALHRAAVKTVATLDTASDELKFLTVLIER